jgi:curved DNA-binding protein CbpA
MVTRVRERGDVRGGALTAARSPRGLCYPPVDGEHQPPARSAHPARGDSEAYDTTAHGVAVRDSRVTLYRLLMVDPSADTDIIQTVYRRLAQRYHPDVATGPEAARRMKEINVAWDVLRDPGKRAAYDLELERKRDRRRSDRLVRPSGHGAAGPPPGNPSGTVLEFGRYSGWSIGEIARHDPDFLEWLYRTPTGRPFTGEIEKVLTRMGRSLKPTEDHFGRR